MSKRVLIGLLAVSILAMWGSTANAFNRINGIIIKHRSIEVEVTLCGDPLEDTLLTLLLELKVEIQCLNPAGKLVPGKPGHQTFPLTFEAFQGVPSADFTTAVTCESVNNNNATTLRTFTFDLASEEELKCKQKKFTKLPGSELVKSAEVTAKWCTDDNENNACQDEERIEFVETVCIGSRDGEGPPPEDATSCDPVEHVDGLEGVEPPPLTADAYYDFQQWVANNSEQGFDNSAPFTDIENGLTLTATAFESPGSISSHVYMDGLSSEIIGGMGVCSNLDEDDHCDPSSDDSVSIDGGNKEILRWNFSHDITEVTLELGDDNHFNYGSREFQYQYGAQGWQTAMTNSSGIVTLDDDDGIDGSSDQLMFRAVDASSNHRFYIRNADVTYAQ